MTMIAPEVLDLIGGHGPYPDHVLELFGRVYALGLEHGLKTWSMLGPDQRKKLAEWKKEQDAEVARRQGKGRPYYGATGGAYVYIYCPTSMGVVTQVKNDLTGEQIDLTDYEGW